MPPPHLDDDNNNDNVLEPEKFLQLQCKYKFALLFYLSTKNKDVKNKSQ
jgi:hypothetical protein